RSRCPVRLHQRRGRRRPGRRPSGDLGRHQEKGARRRLQERRTRVASPRRAGRGYKIEHRLFSFISQNWRAKPLVSYQVIVDLISATTTSAGLEVRCEFDANTYPKGVTVSDAEMAALNLECAEFHGEWNYTIRPTNRSDRAV